LYRLNLQAATNDNLLESDRHSNCIPPCSFIGYMRTLISCKNNAFAI